METIEETLQELRARRADIDTAIGALERLVTKCAPAPVPAAAAVVSRAEPVERSPVVAAAATIDRLPLTVKERDAAILGRLAKGPTGISVLALALVSEPLTNQQRCDALRNRLFALKRDGLIDKSASGRLGEWQLTAAGRLAAERGPHGY